jgi:hypothetical protein
MIWAPNGGWLAILIAHPKLVTLSDVEPTRASWLWPGRLAAGKVHLLWGDPGLGKSTITLDMAARVSRGSSWPDAGTAPCGHVVILTAEDALADTVRPRLDAHGADVALIHVLTAIQEKSGQERSVSLDTDVALIEQAVIQTGAVLVIIDPVSAYMGAANTFRDADVRAILAPLAALAERTGAALYGVMQLTKNAQIPALYRGQGSIASAGAARFVQAVAPDPADPTRQRRLFVSITENLSAPAATLAYRITPGDGCRRLEWERAPVEGVNVDAVFRLQASQDVEERTDAQAFLLDELADGPVRSTALLKAAAAHGFSRRTIFRARQHLAVEAVRVGFGPGAEWHWQLVDRFPKRATTTTEASKDAIDTGVAPYDERGEKRLESSVVSSKSATADQMASFATNLAPNTTRSDDRSTVATDV